MVVFLRHAATDYSRFDTGRLNDRSGQRNLSEAGRVQAEELGGAFASLGIEFSRILTSPVYRARDTAEIAFGPGRVEVTTDLIADDYAGGGIPEMIAATKGLLDTEPEAGVEAISDDPFIADAETDVIDGDVDLGPLRLVQERAGADRRGPVRLQHADEIAERVPRVDDVFDDQHVAILDVAADVHDQSHGAAGDAAVFVTRHGDEFDSPRHVQAAGQIREEDEGALQDADEDDLALVAIVVRDLVGQLFDATTDIAFADQDGGR